MNAALLFLLSSLNLRKPNFLAYGFTSSTKSRSLAKEKSIFCVVSVIDVESLINGFDSEFAK